MKKIAIILLVLLFFASFAFAGIYITEPSDQFVTFDRTIVLKGAGRDLEVLKVNDRDIGPSPDGAFSCGLVLRYGKNFVEVRALDREGKHYIKTMRILALRTFPDVETLSDGKKHWARNQIVYLSTLGFIEGYPDDNFYPGNPVTRGEFATWIARIKSLPLPTLTEDVFFDVPKEHWRAPYVKAVVDAGYMSPYDKQSFGLDDPLSRREAAEIVVKTEGVGVLEKVKPLFVDVPKEEKGAFPIYIAKEEGLIKGVSEVIPVYEPDRALTRAEGAVLMARFKRSLDAAQYLFSFEKGYSPASFCGINIAPEIMAFTVEPASVQLNSKAVVKLRTQIASRESFAAISRVTVDLSEIGGMPDSEMADDGTHGDVAKGDLVYSLNISLEPKEVGTKTLTTTVIDRLGWEAQKETSLQVIK